MRRDVYGIIVQTDAANPAYEDGGDSSFSTGIMSMTGSTLDSYLMKKFITMDHEIVRHPFQNTNTGTHPHNDPKSISRDQVIAFFSGTEQVKIKSVENYEFVQAACLNYAKKWFVNKDFMLPSVRLYLYKCADKPAPILISLLGYPFLFLSLLWTCFVKPNSEVNQSVCMMIIMGDRWIKMLYKWHPDLLFNIRDYFGGWRDRSEIGERLIVLIASKI